MFARMAKVRTQADDERDEACIMRKKYDFDFDFTHALVTRVSGRPTTDVL